MDFFPVRVQVFVIVRAIFALLLHRQDNSCVYVAEKQILDRRQVAELSFLLLGLNPESLLSFYGSGQQ